MKRIRAIVLPALILVAIVSAGCGAMGEAPSQGESAAFPPGADYATDEGGAATAPAVPQEERPAVSGGTGAGSDMDISTDATDRLVVRNGSMEIVVEDVNDAAGSLGRIAATYGGHVVSSSIYEDNGRTFGSVVIRVDADSFDTAIAAIRSLSVEVVRENTSATDVTEEYVDLNARVRNLQRTEEQLLQLLEQAGSVEELLEVQRELSDVRGQIEQLEGRIRYLEQTSAMSLIEVYLRESILSVSFTADSRLVDEGEPVAFESEVSGGFSPYSYQWDFGDGEVSNEANPSHVYEDEGQYSVLLTVTDDHGARQEAYRDYYIGVRGVWSPGDVFGDAVSGLGGFGRWLLGVVIWLLVFTPLWAAIAGVAYLLYRIARRGRRQRS
jgi:PKD repeat protein